MTVSDRLPILSEINGSYPVNQWVEVLVDCPGVQELYTYAIPPGLTVQPGDILSVPLGPQQVGAIAVRYCDRLPDSLSPRQVKLVAAVISTGFFPPSYWALLQQVADYYHTPLLQVVRVALPPGLLARSQRRVRLIPSNHHRALITETTGLSPAAQHLLTLLQASKTGDYSWNYLNRQAKTAARAIQELVQAGWAETYLEPPTPIRPKRRQVVTLVIPPPLTDLPPRQQAVIQLLKRQGGELWLTDLLQQAGVSSTTLKALAQKGWLVIQEREVLRTESGALLTPDSPKCLISEQAGALAQIQALEGFAQVLLHGVTGSGKTEVYLQAIAPLLQKGQSALVLVPEIGLTPQLTDRFRARFGNQVCVYHSALSEGERYDTWRHLLTGQAQIVIGTRSAVFAPLPHLGLIILDEEHDGSFKQEHPAPCYHARTVAHWRAQLENCPLILGSATPSLETWVTIHRLTAKEPCQPPPVTCYLSLPKRVQDRPLPTIQVIDMRQELQQGNPSIFSRSLQTLLHSLRDRQQQGILFIHRRGHSTFVSCRSCGHVVHCPNCDVSLAYHHVQPETRPLLRCHYCNYVCSVPKTCPACDSTYFKFFGSGTQRVEQELSRQFPDLRVLRFDSDTTRTKGAHRAILSRFAAGEVDLLVGTQMLTKGIDLPLVTLVGIVAADGLLYLSDYRASERAFQTLTQVAGRCGRGDAAGQVILQTYSPQHPVIQAVLQQNDRAFLETELEQRRSQHYPPFAQLVLIRLSSLNPVAVQTAAERVAAILAPLQQKGIEVLGPAPATILRLARRYRWHILLKRPLMVPLELPDISIMKACCAETVSLVIDIDPIAIG
ncbi:MAG: primosomal protein N' [Leptolyngbyaceae cyanobacterium]